MYVWYEILSAVCVNANVFWAVTRCTVIQIYRRFPVPCRLHRQTPRRDSRFRQKAVKPLSDYTAAHARR